VLGGETVAFDDVCIPLMRYGSIEDFWFTQSCSPLRDESFAIAGVLVTLVETTSRVEAQQLEAEREQLLTQVQLERSRLTDVFEQGPVAVAVLTGPDHVCTIVSPAYARYVSDRTLLGRAFRDAVPEAVGASASALMDSVYRTGVPVVRAEQVVPIDRGGDGVPEEYIFNVSYQPLRNRAGAVYAITSLSTDVTEQVRARGIADAAAREVAHARKQLEFVFSQAPTAIAVLDGPEHRFVLANPSYNRLVNREFLMGQTVRDAFPELAGQGIFETLDGVFTTGKAFVASELEVSLRRARDRDPQQAFFNVSYQPLCTADGEVYGIGVVAVDVTESVQSRHRIEGLLRDSEVSLDALENQAWELEEQRRIAHDANQAKGLFLATMSHELRTPLNAVGGYADLLLSGVRGDLTPVQRSDVERIRHSGKYLLGLINSILNFTKLDAGDIEFDVRPIAVRTLLHGVSDLVAPQIAAKSQHFTTVGCDAVARVLADTDKAHQILLNLLTNALKFTGIAGAITLSCVVREEWVEIQVTDTGRGIVPENVERIFNPFVQVDRHLTPSSQQGVGLGLAISRDLAVGMGGHLTVSSVPGKGSTFTLALRRDLAALSS
jgi:signal transduction histidine kinase